MNNDLNTLTPLFEQEDVSQLKDDSEIDIKNFCCYNEQDRQNLMDLINIQKDQISFNTDGFELQIDIIPQIEFAGIVYYNIMISVCQ